VIRDAVDAAVGVVRVARSARVTRVRSDGTVDVQPTVAEPVWSQGVLRWELPPELPAVPVQWWRSGGAAVTGRLDVGTEVLLLVRDLDHGDADAGQAGERPTSARRWDLTDAVVLAGFTGRGAWPSNSLPSSSSDVVAYMQGGGVLYVGDATAVQLLARADLVLAELQDIALTLTTGTTPSGAVVFGTPYTAPLTPDAIASNRVRVTS